MEDATPVRSEGRGQLVQAGLAQLFALGLVAAATLCRLWLGQRVPDLLPFNLYYPVILAAGLAGGWPAATTALVTSGLLGWRVFLPGAGDSALTATEVVNLLLFAFSGGFMAYGGAHLRALLHRQRASHERLAERELRYRTLFDAISEGFALVHAVRDAEGTLVDYVIAEANPAILRMLGTDASVIGRRGSEVVRNAPAAWLGACDRALKGDPLTFEYHAPGSRRWFEIHLSRVAPDQLAQFVMEITDRKTADARQSELFDELNHRVKNNLALISSMLGLQARGSAPDVRAQLQKAVDRIQAIADVHARLYRSSRKDDVDFGAYLTDLCRRLSESLLDDERVRITVQAEPVVMSLDRAVALGVVVNELVTNAAKHAYPERGSGEIAVRLERIASGLVLSVSDTGQGLPGDLSGDGLGMRLVRSLVQQIGGTLEIERSTGAAFHVRLPDPGPVLPSSGGQGRLL
ncbi:sensor histidine kinase [Phenylobacterium sp.]|uniref:sensor histidine kinase n=1 Tax=Phenylobacterium sp. TaxID=1871053 RepID=UPI002CA612FC|nr:histidine kinase dimerization/phosphoacceptor domain -containing protein [Phenylobacterium sp.]HVI33802.1 histidine kinase dimerization/phosphoacceptor domain -containing protein [Phenylobacterium sp.]